MSLLRTSKSWQSRVWNQGKPVKWIELVIIYQNSWQLIAPYRLIVSKNLNLNGICSKWADSISIDPCFFEPSCGLFPNQKLLCLSVQVWLGHRNHTVKTSGPASLSAGRGLPGGGQLWRADGGEREALLHKQGSAWPPLLDSPPRSTERRQWGKASENTTHHIPPKQTSKATQIFQLEPWEGGRKWISVALHPLHHLPPAEQCWLWGREGEVIHRALWTFTERLRTC